MTGRMALPAGVAVGSWSPAAEAIGRRVATVRQVLGLSPAPPGSGLLQPVESILERAKPSELWLLLSVLTGRLPCVPDVHELVRAAKLGHGGEELGFRLDRSGVLEADSWPDVEVIVGTVVVDVHHTACNPFVTGIQRVAREAVRRWVRDHEVVLLGWTEDFSAYRRLRPPEVTAALTGVRSPPAGASRSATDDVPPASVVVPWKCVHIVPELAAEPERAHRYQAFVAFSGSTTGLVGHDCVPLVAAETCVEGMAVGFAAFLAAAANVDRIATNSASSAAEFGGWRSMLAATGRSGPDIRAIPLGVDVHLSTQDALAEARRLMCIGSLPAVLAVGSHEPRKNHLALIHAAELLWREGLQFTLTFVGGNAWNSAEFLTIAAELQAARRPLQVLRDMSDDLLWAAYRIAYCTVFPSLHEGFGLPVAESLVSGTPVITSSFGSMAENASRGGAMLVDPHSDHELAAALRALLTDPALRGRLAAEATAVPLRSWDDYAKDTWEYFVGDTMPG
jgi:glycosyltransferase involved in cell wall biosynthesis